MDNATNIKRKAQELARSGQFEEAITVYTRLADQNMLEPYDLVVLGDLLNRSGNRDAAVQRYTEAITSYATAGLNRNAIALAKKVQRIAPGFTAANKKLGELYAAEGLSSESCLHYLEYLESLDHAAGDHADEVQEVCTKLLQLSLPSFDVVTNVIKIARQSGRESALTQGVLHQAERAAQMRNTEAEAKLRECARALGPTPGPPPGEMAAAPGAEPDREPQTFHLDPAVVDLDVAEPAPGDHMPLEDIPREVEGNATLENPAIMGTELDGDSSSREGGKIIDLEAAVTREEPPPVETPPTADIPPPVLLEEEEEEQDEAGSADPDVLRARGLDYHQNNEPARAQRAFMRAAVAYFDSGRSRDAADLYELVVRMDPNHLEALRGLVEIAHINGERSKMAHWGCELGDVLLARERYGEAKMQFERVLAFDADNPKARSRVRRLNTIAGVKESEFGELTPAASEMKGAQVTVRDEEAGASQSAFDLSEILEEFRAAVVDHIPAEDGQSHYDLGMTYKEMDLLQEAAHEFEMAASHGDNRTASLEMLGECYLELDQNEDAIRVLEQVFPLADDVTRAATHVRLGKALEALGEWDRAEEQYYTALELNSALTEASELLESLERRREQGAA